jgi:hypothetical protein
MYCPNCGTKNGNEYKFCPNCGFEIGKIHLKNDNELNQIKVSTKIVDFPSEVWNKLVIKNEDINLFIEHGVHADVFDDEDVIYTQEIIDIQKKFILTKADIDLLISSINSDYNYIVDDEDEELSHYFFGQIKNGQKHGFVCYIRGTKDDEDTEMKYLINYSGSWVNDEREGFGIEISPYHPTPNYIGEWKDNSYNGHGTVFYSRKGRYTGEWENGSYNGFGIRYYDNGEKQDEGQFKNDKLNGQGCSYFYNPIGVIRLQGIFENDNLINGIEYNSDGQKKYEGIFKDGNILNGIAYDNGLKFYEGEFKSDEETAEDGICHGKGKLFFDDGNFSEGDFVDGELIKGKKTLLNLAFLEGDFVDGELIKGNITYDSGLVYEGDFVENKLNGKGKLTLGDGSVFEGDFVNGELNGKGKKTFSSGTVFEGDFVNGELNGKGKKIYSNGWCFEGDYVNDLQEGKGISKHANGERYIGNYLNGIPTGDFEYININGESVLGYFKCTKVGNEQNNEFYAYDLKTNNSGNNDNQSPIPPKDGAGLR